MAAAIEDWLPSNPLCELAATTNIPSLGLTGWDCDDELLPTSDYCTWTGVTCVNQSAPFPMNTTIGSLTLSNTGLTGSLPTAIGNMAFLTSLDLSRNALQQANLPSQLGLLQSITFMDLSHNSFGGSLPSEIFNNFLLVELNLQNNLLTNQLPDNMNLAQVLQSLNFSNNNFTGTVPSTICSDAVLTYLDIQNNDIECFERCVQNIATFLPGDTFDCYLNLEQDQGIALCDLYMATNIPSLVSQDIIGGWDCAQGAPVTDVCDWFGVYCGENSNEAWDDIVVLNTTVVELSLPFLGVTGTLPNSLSLLSYLFSFNFEGNSLQGTIPAELGNWSFLLSFDVEGNQLSGTVPNYPTWGNLLEFSVANNTLSGTMPQFVMDLVYLQDLLVQDNQMTGKIPVEMCNASSINTLDISNNLFTCYANCLVSVPHLINEQNISTCNFVSVAPISQTSIIYIVIGVACGGAVIVIGLLWFFARDKISWLLGEVHQFVVRMTEDTDALLDDLDFSNIRSSMVSGYEHHSKDLSSSHFVDNPAAASNPLDMEAGAHVEMVSHNAPKRITPKRQQSLRLKQDSF